MSDPVEKHEDFGKALEEFEDEQDAARGRRTERGELIRQEDEMQPDPEQPEHLAVDTGDESDFGAALEAFESEQPDRVAGGGKEPGPGDRVSGTILTMDLEVSLVDIGTKAEAMVRTDDLTAEDGSLLYEPGERISGEIVGRDEESGALILRPSDAPARSGAHLQEGDLVEGTVTAVNPGGVDVEIGERRAFCPISQLADRFVEDASEYVGRSMRFRVLRVEEGRRGDLVVSRRAHLEEQKEARAEQLRSHLEPGAVLRGKVTALERYGAFVDLGGIEGLLHVSQLSHRRVDHPSDLLKVGEEVEVKVLEIERDPEGRDRISLSRKALERDPWLDAVSQYGEGTTTEGKVRRLESFGAFVELEPGVEGLLHVSELGRGRRISHPREVLEEGQTLGVRVLSLDPEKRRIGLQPVDEAEVAGETPAVRELLEEKRKTGGGFGAMGDFFDKAKKKKG